MKEFTLIALRPLEGCNNKFVKILKENNPYVFYNNYDFSKYTDEIRTISINENKTKDLYSFKNNLNKEIRINFSAIVGENGSGKSSIVELFYVCCFNLSTITGILYDEEEERYLNSKDIVPDIKVELFYKIDNKIYLLRLDNLDIKIYTLENSTFKLVQTKFNLNDFFYTISINYSLHSLNSNVLGEWVKKIFHKNDGYQTPIVLNPFRNKGNIDINNEEYLVKSRTISNVLGKINNKIKASESLRNIIDNKVAYKLKIELNKNKFKFNESTKKPIFENTNRFGDIVLPIIYKHFLGTGKFIPNDTLLNSYAKEYILYKVISISKKYQPYKRLFRFLDESIISEIDKTEAFIKMLASDKSHVTFKLKQAINFLSNDLYYKRKESFELTVSYLSNQLDKESKLKGKELIDILPPAFFNIDIEFQNSDTFSLLSSGEKQRIYSISTLIYHLNNLSSVSKVHALYKYNHVNVIFDELELYFHPELQRNLINDIIESVKKIDLKEIDSINVLLITHSPFILSDIPDSNILFLEKSGLPFQNRENIRTFGGNIHELLAHSFFLEKGFIGEFAKNKIQEIINYLKTNQKDDNKTSDFNQDSVFEKIQIIGEPFLREKLLEMFYAKFETAKKDRISELENELKKLKREKIKPFLENDKTKKK